MPTIQETFDTVARHLLTQNARSTLGGSCRYRGECGLKCAVGCLISDEEYEKIGELIEGVGFEAVDTRANWLYAWANRSGYAPRLLFMLQRVHDVVNIANWPRALAIIARLLGLNADVLSDAIVEIESMDDLIWFQGYLRGASLLEICEAIREQEPANTKGGCDGDIAGNV